MRVSFSNKRQVNNLDSRIAMFLDSLRNEKQLPAWQVEQAGDAIRLYIDLFLFGDASLLSPDPKPDLEVKNSDYGEILDKLGEALRIKHYSYSTERTLRSALFWLQCQSSTS